MSNSINIIWIWIVLLAFALGLLMGGYDRDIVVAIYVVGMASFWAGLLVYRDDAKKFQKIEKLAKEKGKTINELFD
ncbi:MAG: hypothetical protein ABIL39_10645 [candidate division WOR-3 bacterium]